jgi:hypothetical protein
VVVVVVGCQRLMWENWEVAMVVAVAAAAVVVVVVFTVHPLIKAKGGRRQHRH